MQPIRLASRNPTSNCGADDKMSICPLASMYRTGRNHLTLTLDAASAVKGEHVCQLGEKARGTGTARVGWNEQILARAFRTC